MKIPMDKIKTVKLPDFDGKKEHPGWDLPPVIEPEDKEKQPHGWDLPPNEWEKWKKKKKKRFPR